MLAAVAAPLLVFACLLPWWKVGGTAGIPAIDGNGFEGAGIVVFLIGVASLALVVLPYASGDRPLAIDRWVSFLMLVLVGWIGLALRVVTLAADGAFQFADPTHAFTNGPGVWIAGIGLIVLSRATYDMAREHAER